MLQQIIDLIVAGRNRFTPVWVLDPYESGGVIRLGTYNRTIGQGGWHWKIPLLETVIEVTTCVTTWRSPAQTLTTKDGVVVVVAGVLKYSIRNVQPYITQIYDQGDVLADVTMGAIRRVVAGMTYADLIANPPEKDILDTVRKEANEYGFKLERFTFTDLARIRTIRLMNSHLPTLEN